MLYMVMLLDKTAEVDVTIAWPIETSDSSMHAFLERVCVYVCCIYSDALGHRLYEIQRIK